MAGGDAIWIPPEATRQIRNGDVESSFVLVSAPEDISWGASDESQCVLQSVQS